MMHNRQGKEYNVDKKNSVGDNAITKVVVSMEVLEVVLRK